MLPALPVEAALGIAIVLKAEQKPTSASPATPQRCNARYGLGAIWESVHCCAAPKKALILFGIGRQVHHVLPYAEEGHKGPLVPICTLCHPVVTERQRLYWFYQRLVSKAYSEETTDSVDVSQTIERLPDVRRA